MQLKDHNVKYLLGTRYTSHNDDFVDGLLTINLYFSRFIAHTSVYYF